MKLLLCGHCGDVVRLFSERRTCKCGKSWGNYLEDGSTAVQSNHTLSLGLHNHDLNSAIQAFNEDSNSFSPLVWIRAWINPVSEPDVVYAPENFEAGDEPKP